MSTFAAISVEAFGDSSALKVHNLPLLKVSQGLVLIALKAAGVNPVDTYIRAGTYARKPQLPYTPGADGAGVVEEVGEGVTSFKKGDRVYVTGSETGTYASACLAKESNVYHLPSNSSFEQGASLNVPYGTAYRALIQKCHAKPGESVLIHGASGGVGTAAVQIAKSRGLTVYGTAGSDDGVEFIKSNGCDFALNHRTKGYLDEIKNRGGVDIIIEMLANVNLSEDLQALAVGGRVAVVGNRGSIEINPRDAMAREASIIGVALAKQTPSEKAEAHAAIFAGLSCGALSPIIGQTYTLEEAPKSHEDVINQNGSTKGKLVITM